MSVLAVGLSHATAPVATLERAVVSGDAQLKLLRDVHGSDNVAGCFVLSTCNRIEVYAEVDRFHGGVAAICELIARHSSMSATELTGTAYVHYEERAAAHLLAVTCGLESMVVGESQILGQVRQAVKLARQSGTLSRELSDLSRVALRAGRRAHAETGIDAAGQSLVTLGLDLAARQLGGPAQPKTPLRGRSVLVIGAGSMSALAVATAVRQGADQVVIANRTPGRAERLAAKYSARATGLADLPASIAAADLVITCTGAAGLVVTEPIVAVALSQRDPARPLVLLDLALPRDIAASTGDLPGTTLIDLATMGAGKPGLSGQPGESGQPAGTALVSEADVAAVRQIVAQELAAYLKADRAASVAPTVVALRARAATVVEAELARLERRLGSDMDPRSRREIAQAMGRIADKLLHAPTVRMKELAGAPGADAYEAALRVLFGLDPDAVQAVSQPDGDLLEPQ